MITMELIKKIYEMYLLFRGITSTTIVSIISVSTSIIVVANIKEFFFPFSFFFFFKKRKLTKLHIILLKLGANDFFLFLLWAMTHQLLCFLGFILLVFSTYQGRP